MARGRSESRGAGAALRPAPTAPVATPRAGAGPIGDADFFPVLVTRAWVEQNHRRLSPAQALVLREMRPELGDILAPGRAPARERTPAERARDRARPLLGAFARRVKEAEARLGLASDSQEHLERLTAAAGIIGSAEQRVLVLAAQAGDRRSRDLLMLCNRRFVVSVARAHLGAGVELEDLISEGQAGLLMAIERYRPDEKATFLTYARWWIRSQMTRSIQETGAPIPLPSYLHDVQNKARRSLRRLEARQVGAPSLEQIAEGIEADSGRPVDRGHLIHALEAMNRRLLSIDSASTIGDVEAPLAHAIADPQPSHDDLIARRETAAELVRHLAALPPMQRMLIARRFGMDGEEPESAVALRNRFGLSKGRYDNTLKKGIETLRGSLEGEGLSLRSLVAGHAPPGQRRPVTHR